MFGRRRLVGFILFVLLVGGLLSVGGSAIYRAGYSQGLATELASGAEEGLAPFPGYPYGPRGAYGFGFGFLPLLCGIGILFFAGMFLLGGIAKAFRFRRMRMHPDGPGREYWGRKWHEYHYGEGPREGEKRESGEKADEGDTPASRDK